MIQIIFWTKMVPEQKQDWKFTSIRARTVWTKLDKLKMWTKLDNMNNMDKIGQHEHWNIWTNNRQDRIRQK